MIRLGLCCQFAAQPIKFRVATARHVKTLGDAGGREYLDRIALDNALALRQSLAFCAVAGIGAFRINSQFLPLYTHPDVGYRLDALPSAVVLKRSLAETGKLARQHGIRLSFHPDQFVVPGSPDAETARKSLEELEYQAEVARHVGAEQVSIHGGGAYGDKQTALKRLFASFERLSAHARSVLALENDDRVYTPEDLLPFCRQHGVPLIYDVHHHRCLPDGLSIAEATEQAAATWGKREPYNHISSPLGGWTASDPRMHDDYINPSDWPAEWTGRSMTVDVEAKAKELAVLALKAFLDGRPAPLRTKVTAAKKRATRTSTASTKTKRKKT